MRSNGARGGAPGRSMPADRKDLAARVAVATPEDTARGLNCNSVFRLLRDLEGEKAAGACDPLGKGSRADLTSYPIAEYLALAWNAADRLEARLGGVEAAFEAMGRRTIEDYLGSVLGRTLYAIAGRDARRMVSNVPTAYRATVSYGERAVEWRGERHAHIVFRRDFHVPAFHCGILAAGVEGMGARNVKARGRETGFLSAEFDVTWE